MLGKREHGFVEETCAVPGRRWAHGPKTNSPNQLPLAVQGQELLKEIFREIQVDGRVGGGGASCRTAPKIIIISKNHLEIGRVVV